MISIQANEIPTVAKYIYDISGITLDNSKAYLLEARLTPLLKEHGCANFLELLQKAKFDPRKSINNQIIDAITTNETLFFRDKSPFELLKQKILPEIIDSKGGITGGKSPHIRIWSAASSTGQELYSIAITAKELLGTTGCRNIQLVGTDISNSAVAKASYGEFNKFEIERGLGATNAQKYFQKKDENFWKIKDEIRAMAQFKKFNLMDSFASLGKFDIIFCRNVAIYFTLDDRKELFNKIEKSLSNTGVLILGSTESLNGVSTNFVAKRHLNSTYYIKK